MKEILLKTEKLSKSFSNGGAMRHVLRNIDLELYKGDFTVIMGASGAGKSTLLYALSGMDTPTLGTITFGERVISDLSQDALAVLPPEHRQSVLGQVGNDAPAKGDGAQGGCVHAGQGVQQGGLARTAGPHDDGEVAFVQLQVDVFQNVLHGTAV